MLSREPWFLTREQFMDLDDWTMINVYFRPNLYEHDPEVGYWPVPRVGEGRSRVAEPIAFDAMVYDLWKKRGMTDAEIDAKFRKKYRRPIGRIDAPKRQHRHR